MSIQILGVFGSLRQESSNQGLVKLAQKLAPADITFTFYDKIGSLPFYNEDLEDSSRTPASVLQWRELVSNSDALFIASPEYNFGPSAVLKNAIDWASRYPDNALLAGKAVAICGAGGGMGTSRAQYHLRQVCVYLDLHPLNKPEVFANAFAGGFDADGNVIDEKIKTNLTAQLLALKAWSERLRGKD